MTKKKLKISFPKWLVIVLAVIAVSIGVVGVLKIAFSYSGRSISGSVTHIVQGPSDAPTGEQTDGSATLLIGTDTGMRAALQPQKNSYGDISKYRATEAETSQHGLREVKVEGKYRVKLNDQENAICIVTKSGEDPQYVKQGNTTRVTYTTYYNLSVTSECKTINRNSSRTTVNISTMDFGKSSLNCSQAVCSNLEFKFK